MYKYLIALLFVVNSIPTIAQDSTIIYYDKDWEVQDWEIDAAYYRVQVTYAETGLIEVKDFWISGDIQMTGSFISNTEEESKNGLFTYYVEGGDIESEVTFLKGEKHGIEKEWYGLDSLMSIQNYTEGELEGESLWYYESGKLKEQVFYKEDAITDISTSWFENGVIESVKKCNDFNLDSVYYWYENGDKRLEGNLLLTSYESLEHIKYWNYWDSLGKQIIVNGYGVLITENDNEYWEGEILNGLAHGVWQKYDKSERGKSIGQMKFKNGTFKKGYLNFQGDKIYLEDRWVRSPEFPKGHKGLSSYISDYLYDSCDDIIENSVYVEFVVYNDGKTKDIKIVSGKTTVCQEEYIFKMFDNMPIWKPGIQLGYFVNVRYTVPIKYKL
jgi:antitoxin component YwqK of YwqJK toxin-antitoxin module